MKKTKYTHINLSNTGTCKSVVTLATRHLVPSLVVAIRLKSLSKKVSELEMGIAFWASSWQFRPLTVMTTWACALEDHFSNSSFFLHHKLLTYTIREG